MEEFTATLSETARRARPSARANVELGRQYRLIRAQMLGIPVIGLLAMLMSWSVVEVVASGEAIAGLGLLLLFAVPTLLMGVGVKLTIARFVALRSVIRSGEVLLVAGTLQETAFRRRGGVIDTHQLCYKIDGVWFPVRVEGGGTIVDGFNYRIGHRIRMEVAPDQPEMVFALEFVGSSQPAVHDAEIDEKDLNRFVQRAQAAQRFAWITAVVGLMIVCLMLPWRSGMSVLQPMVAAVCMVTLLSVTVFWIEGGASWRFSKRSNRVIRRVVCGDLEEVLFVRSTFSGAGPGMRITNQSIFCRVGGVLYRLRPPEGFEGRSDQLADIKGEIRIELAVVENRWRVLRAGSPHVELGEAYI